MTYTSWTIKEQIQIKNWAYLLVTQMYVFPPA
jgi:hypothetical protein